MATNSELIARAYLSRINYLQSEVAALKSYLVLERVQKDRLAFKLSESQKKGTKAQEELAKAALKREQAINISADVIAHSKELLGYLKGYHDDNAVMKKDHNTMHAALLKALEKAGDLSNDTTITRTRPTETTGIPPLQLQKPTKRDRHRIPLASRIVICTRCYFQGFICDKGTPCQGCVRDGKTCERKQCELYELGVGKCRKRDCPFAHPEDEYANTIRMGKMKKPAGFEQHDRKASRRW